MSVSTIGGNVAESSGGLRGLKYGTTKDYVMGMEVFANTGDLVKTGSRTVKCATGYNIAPLLVGSEGTLAVTSKVTLKLIPPPKASKAMMALFKDMDGASQAVAGIIAAHVVPCTLEFLDHASINYIEDYVKIGLPRDAGAMLLIEVDGHPAQVEDEAVIVEKVLRDNSATEIVVARDAAEKSRIWEARRVAIPALARCRPTLMLEDATVPRSKIPGHDKALDEIAARHNVTIATFGHAGDGNLHPSILCDRRDKEEFSRVERAVDDLFNAALELGGTLSGEHGIGTAKIKWLEQETSHGTIMFSRRLRKAFDPKGCSTRARSWDSGTSCRKGTGGGLWKAASPGPSKDLNGRGGGMKGVAERRFRCSVANDRGPAVSSPVNLPNPAQNRPRLEGSGRPPPAGVRERD